jgi:hypothetical protein
MAGGDTGYYERFFIIIKYPSSSKALIFFTYRLLPFAYLSRHFIPP